MCDICAFVWIFKGLFPGMGGKHTTNMLRNFICVDDFGVWVNMGYLKYLILKTNQHLPKKKSIYILYIDLTYCVYVICIKLCDIPTGYQPLLVPMKSHFSCHPVNPERLCAAVGVE